MLIILVQCILNLINEYAYSIGSISLDTLYNNKIFFFFFLKKHITIYACVRYYRTELLQCALIETLNVDFPSLSTEYARVKSVVCPISHHLAKVSSSALGVWWTKASCVPRFVYWRPNQIKSNQFEFMKAARPATVVASRISSP